MLGEYPKGEAWKPAILASAGKEAENTDTGQAGSALDLWNPC